MGAEFLVDAALGKNAKFRDLAKRLAGFGNASWVLIRLWSFAAANRPDGDLSGIDPAEIPLTEVEWASLIAARGPRSSVGFLEVAGDVVAIHDWSRSEKHQTALSRRQNAARIAGLASAALREEADDHAFKAARALLVGPKVEGETEEAFALRIQGNGKVKPVGVSPLSAANVATEKWLDEGFEWFYSVYPKHEGRFEGRKAWGKLHRILLISEGNKGISVALKKRMVEFIQEKLRSGDWEPTPDRKKYIPAISVFLNQRKWEV